MSSSFFNTGGQSGAAKPGGFSFLDQQSSSQPATSTSSLFPPLSGQPSTTSAPAVAPAWGTASTTTTSQPLGSSLFVSGASQSSMRGQSVFGSLLGGGSAGAGDPRAQSQSGQDVKSSLAQGENLQPAFFNSLLEKGKKDGQSTNGLGSSFGQLPTLQLNLSDIASRARELGGGRPQREKLGGSFRGSTSVRLDVTTPAAVRRPHEPTLRSSRPSGSLPQDRPKEPDPLELDNEKFVRSIQQRSRQAMIEENFARTQREFDAYLEESMSLNWDEQRRRIYEHFGLAQKLEEQDETLNFSNTTRGAFGKSAKKGRSQGVGGASVGSAGVRSVMGRSGMEKSVIGTPGIGSSNAALFNDTAERTGNAAPDDRFVREREESFAAKIGDLNEARPKRIGFPILHDFAEVEAKSGGAETPTQVIDAYHALIHITGERAAMLESSNPEALTERQFARAYLSDKPNEPETIALRRKVIDGSRQFLEQQCQREIDRAIDKNPLEARRGPIPTTISKFKAYVRIQEARKNLVPDGFMVQTIGDGDMPWPVIFFLLRCGLVEEAARYVSYDPHFKIVDKNFITYMNDYANSADRRLNRSLQEKINAEYQQRSRNNPEHAVDPYRLACYKIIGRCELQKRTLDSIPPKVEDWIWLQFNMARESSRVDEVATEVFGLDELCESIVEIGQRHFSKGSEGSGPFGTFFLLQILGGMFEQAVAYLYNYSYVSAVHFAIALDYYGLLRVSDFYTAGNELLAFTTRQQPQINFGRMIGYYTRDFRSANAEAAVDYLTMICLNQDLGGNLGKSQVSVCHEALRELVLETREFAQLLGDIRSDGTRIPGAIEKRLRLIHLGDQEEFLNAVTIQAAVVADESGRTTDAVLLYHLAEDYDNVIAIVNRALSEAVAVDLGEAPPKLQPLKPRNETNGRPDLQDQLAQQERTSFSLTSVEDPVMLAKNMISLYDSNALYYRKIKEINRDACGLLLRMSEAKERAEAGRWTEALDTINQLGILPIEAKSRTAHIRSKATSFSSLPPVVARTVGQLLTWTIHCISSERERLRATRYEDAMSVALEETLLTMAKDLMVFAGMVRYKLPPRVFETLAKAGMDAGAY